VEYPKDFSQELIDLLTLLLSKDPNLRPTAYELVNHKYFNYW
jgi:serine/threonine protein kinase